jgi:hypothetical protein
MPSDTLVESHDVLIDRPAQILAEAEAPERTYHLALGRFLELFSRVEAAAQLVFSHYAEVPLTKVRSELGLTRLDVTVAALSRLLAARNKIEWAKSVDLNAILKQLLLIIQARNDLVPREASIVADGTPAISNSLSHEAGGEDWISCGPVTNRPSKIPLEMLDAMSADLRRILVNFLVGHINRPMFAPGNFSPCYFSPWTYVPPVFLNLAPPAGWPQDARQSPKHQWRHTSRVGRKHRSLGG